jgi:hypothetical protein
MKNALITLLIAGAVVPSSGCGTICNFAGGLIHPETEPKVYGGVQRDLRIIEEACEACQKPASRPSTDDPRLAVVFVAVALTDPLVSFVADTLTLPLTAYIQQRREAVLNSDDGLPPPPTPGAAEDVSLGKPRPVEGTGEDPTAGSAAIKPAE